jgi:hypothetical protein
MSYQDTENESLSSNISPEKIEILRFALNSIEIRTDADIACEIEGKTEKQGIETERRKS